ncbi:hypothetical protein NKG05_00945 [Oerskovia sp. M15]
MSDPSGLIGMLADGMSSRPKPASSSKQPPPRIPRPTRASSLFRSPPRPLPSHHRSPQAQQRRCPEGRRRTSTTSLQKSGSSMKIPNYRGCAEH